MSRRAVWGSEVEDSAGPGEDSAGETAGDDGMEGPGIGSQETSTTANATQAIHRLRMAHPLYFLSQGKVNNHTLRSWLATKARYRPSGETAASALAILNGMSWGSVNRRVSPVSALTSHNS